MSRGQACKFTSMVSDSHISYQLLIVILINLTSDQILMSVGAGMLIISIMLIIESTQMIIGTTFGSSILEWDYYRMA